MSRSEGRSPVASLVRTGFRFGGGVAQPRRGGERHDRGPDQHGQRHVRHDGPGLESRPDVGRTHQDLSGEEHQGGRGEPDEDIAAPRVRPRPDRGPEHEQHRDRGERAVQEHRRGRSAERRDEPAVHQRPVREHELRVAGAHVCADEEQRPDDRREQEREPRERSGAGPDLVPDLDAGEHGARDVRHVGDQQERRHEVHGDPPRVELGRDDDRADPRLRQHEREGEDRRPQEPGSLSRGLDRGHPGERRQHRDEERHRAMGELDQGMDRPRGEQVTGLARRPGGASEPGARPADESTDREQRDRRDRRDEGEGPEAGVGEDHRDVGMIVAARCALGLAILPR